MSIESIVERANKLKKNLWWLHAVRLAADNGELKRDDFELFSAVAKIKHGLKAPSESYTSYIAPLNPTGFGE